MAKKRTSGKRFIVLLLSITLFLNNIAFMDLRLVFAATGQDPSWSQEALNAAAIKGFIPTGLSYRTSTSGIKPAYNFMGEKQYLHGSGAYSDFANRLIYCVDMHEENGGMLLWDAQGFHSNTYNINKLPKDYITGVSEELKKFNFLMLVYTTSYQAKQEAATLMGNANVGVDVLTVCTQLAQEAADKARFTGDWNTDFSWFKEVAYPRALDAVGPTNTWGDSTAYRQLTSTDIPQWVKEKGCKDRAQAIFCYIWTAAKLSSHVELNNGKDSWRFEAVLEEDGMYHVRIPFDGDNQYITEYLRIIQAECYGDWQKLEDTACLQFVSPTGQTPSEGSIAKLTYADSEGMIARNLSEAKLYEFKFYSESNKFPYTPGFDNVQTYFSSIMDQALEIYIITGPALLGGSAGIEVKRYKQEESWNADYNVNLIKYDSETGKPLEEAHFDILESFDDSQLDDTALDLTDANGSDVSIGSLNSTAWGDDTIESNYNGHTGLLQTEALLYNWANNNGSQFERWNDPEEDFCRNDHDITDKNGTLTYRNGAGVSSGEPAHFDVKTYNYHKGYCDGHPAPVIQYEEPSEDDGDGEGEDDGEDIEAYNQQLHDEAWAAWYAEVETCGELASAGGFFHAIDPDIARKAMEADRDQFYEDFISLTYDYSAKELEARKGYILHGLHVDDVEIEWRTVTSSQYKDFMQNGISHTGGAGDGEDDFFRFTNLPVRKMEAERIPEQRIRQTTEPVPITITKPTSFLFIDEESGYTSASPSDAEERKVKACSSSDAEKATPSEAGTPSEAIKRSITFTGLMAERMGGGHTGLSLFRSFAGNRSRNRDSVTFEQSQASVIAPGSSDTIDWTFILYDHRTEGEVHINKQDLDLNQAKSGIYESDGDTQGDSTLEGAVYGLFAANDLVHPDGKTGVVFKKDDLIAVATTDKNGDASFLAITEAPGTCFNFETGALESTGFTSPGNLHTSQAKADAIRDNEQFTGHNSDGSGLSIQDSKAGNETNYKKLTSNQGVDGTGDSNKGYPIQNNEGNNGNCWIGRPLLVSQEGSQYYIMELARSEGYELSRYGVDAEVTNREADAAGTLPSAEGTLVVSELEMNRKGGYNQFTVTSKDTKNGYDLVVAGLHEGAKFYTTMTETVVNPKGTHTELIPVKEPVYGTPEAQIIIDGKAIEAAVGDLVSLPNGSSAAVKGISAPQQLRIGIRPENSFQVEPPVILGGEQPAVKADFIKKVNHSLKKAGYKTPEEGAPWLKIPLNGTTEKSWCEVVTDYLKAYQVFNAFMLEDVIQEGGESYAILRYTYLQGGTSLPFLYDKSGNSVWLRKKLSYRISGKTIDGFLYYEYPSGSYESIEENAAGFVVSATVKQQVPAKNSAVWGEDLSKIPLQDETGKQYWVYAEQEQAYDNKGNPVYHIRYESQQVTPGYEEKTTDTLLTGNYDTDSRLYTIHVEPELIPEDGILDFRIKYDKEFVDGTNTPYPNYVQGNAIVSAFLPLAFRGTYIEHVLLTYPGQAQIYQDAGTRERPVQVFERIIRQKVKIVKDIQRTPEGAYAYHTNAGISHQDRFTKGSGGRGETASKLPNFRFKIYLKSNLERLYRDEKGEIHWLDRNGREVEIDDYQASYPEKEPFGSVQKLYTKVPHQLDSITTGSISNNVWEEAVLIYPRLYSYDADGWLKEEPNPGYIRLLENTTRTTEDGAGKTKQIEAYNYEKFFDAIAVSNHDKWDRKEDGSTSFKPFSFIRELIFGTDGGENKYPASHNNHKVENMVNTSEQAKKNAKCSDAVRQFAITWYLDEEVKKLVEDNGKGENQPAGGKESYQDEVYDRALYTAILKAENYLTPFFAYDLDEIYAIAWDNETDGGRDKDRTTLSADTLYKDEYYYGISKYLPYGTYVTVEQQPYSAELGDFYNKHYKTDSPKEIILPSLYEPDGNKGAPSVYHAFYKYDSKDTPEELQKKYQIRMNEEWSDTHTDDSRNYVIQAHNQDGDFEIYKYGLDADKLAGMVIYPEGSCAYQGFSMAQELFDPYKDVYETENAACGYKSNQKVEPYYHYASISEQSGTAADNNPIGFCFKDGVKTITGSLTGYDGKYFAALVPWTVTEPVDASIYDAETFTGYADGAYRNTFYTSRLRIEKLDSETGENILHDGAIFTLYSADRENEEHSDGRVRFYKKDTIISGSKEFLEAMGAEHITPVARPSLSWKVPYAGNYYGTIPAGTPICREKEQVVMIDETGGKTGQFRAFTTTKDQKNGQGSQNTGYLETPQPLGAGCYVLCEIKAPAGYVRSRPAAVEIYSDEITYYLDGARDHRTAAGIYEEKITQIPDNKEYITNPDGTKSNGNRLRDVARIYINNTPIRLEVTKAKPDEETAAYELNGRLDGSITELNEYYGLENLELAYNASGVYLGYGWKKGFLDSLEKKKEAGESIEVLYEDGVFTGKARLYKGLETAGHKNRYLPGAVMTLYDAIEVKTNGDREDFQFDGVNVERDRYGNVRRLYVQKGFAGSILKYVLDKTEPDSNGLTDFEQYTYEDQEDDRGAGIWTYKTVEREDTDILFYDLGGLTVLWEEKGILYAFDKEGRKIQVKNGASIFALKNGTPFLELICPNYEELKYSAKERVFERVPEGTKFYHLDADKNRDSQINPYTGMAYVAEEKTGAILVWPVKIAKDSHGNIIAREKITTSRIATIQADTQKEWTVGTFRGNAFQKSVNPVLDEHGHLDYYQKSEETYQKGKPVYDRDGDYVRYQYDDKLKAYNDNAWRIETNKELLDIGSDPKQREDDRPLYHRQGGHYIIENTWTTGEAAPDDPFQKDMTAGQADVLKRVPVGLYIMEELKVPSGYIKAMPVGVIVENTTGIQTAKATDWPISGYVDKVDAPVSYCVKVIDRDQVLEEAENRIEGKASYSYKSVEGAKLALYRAKRVSTNDLGQHPLGYYLEKAEEMPASWSIFDGENRKKKFIAEWEVGKIPKYLEAIPKGDYILEEIEAPPGFIRSSMEVVIKESETLHYLSLPNDHTKVEIFKYTEAETGEKIPLSNENPASLAVYEAITDKNGIVLENGVPAYDKTKMVDCWTTDDCREYTEIMDIESSDFADRKRQMTWKLKNHPNLQPSGFILNFERAFEEYEDSFETITWDIKRSASRRSEQDSCFYTSEGYKITVNGNAFLFPKQMDEKDREGFKKALKQNSNALTIGWLGERSAVRVSSDSTKGKESIVQLWKTDSGSQIKIHINRNLLREGRAGYEYDYKFNYKKLNNDRYPNAVSYDTSFGTHRIDYIPLLQSDDKGNKRGSYVLVETKAPDGFKKAEPRQIEVEETEAVQLYSLKNEPKYVEILKTDDKGSVVKGAELSLYLAAADGSAALDSEHLVTTWISGMGSHRITPLAYGVYYLVERSAPKGFERMEPQRIEVADDSPDLIVATNYIKKGVIEIDKRDKNNAEKKLSGAKFEIFNQETKEKIYLITDENGCAKSQPIETGSVDKNGIWSPYQFAIREIAPPDCYALDPSVYKFQFQDMEERPVLFYQLEVVDKETEIYITKTDFESNILIKGAELAIYHARALNGTYEAEGDAIEKWISNGDRHMIKGKLSTGKTYLLKELKAPNGYTCSKPVLFTLSSDGRKIAYVSNQLRRVEFHTSEDFTDAIEAVTISGRQAVKNEVELTDLQTGKVKTLSGQLKRLTAEDGLIEGNLYQQREITYYTDGNRRTETNKIFRMSFNDTGSYEIVSKIPEQTRVLIETEEGEKIDEWTVENKDHAGYSRTLFNPEYEDRQKIQVISENGRHGAAVTPGSIVKYEITYQNTSSRKKPVQISAFLDPQTEYMPANSTKGGKALDGSIVWNIGYIEPGECGKIIVAATVKMNAEFRIKNDVAINGRAYRCFNPVSNAGDLTVVNRVTGTGGEELLESQFDLQILLSDSEGERLPGIFTYFGSKTGRIRSGDTVTLKGNEWITLPGIARGTNYKVVQKAPAGVLSSSSGEMGKIRKEGISAVFVNKRNDPSIREVFQKHKSYHLIEETYYSDGTKSCSDKFTFILNDQASIECIDMKDKATKVVISKIGSEGSQELSGAHLQIRDENGMVKEEWISDGHPHELAGILEAGKTYELIEILPPDGYCYAAGIPFTVSSDGTIDQIWMEDRKTEAEIIKTDITGKKMLSGAVLAIKDLDGKLIQCWVSDKTPQRISGRLKAGESYILSELSPPEGYWKTEDIPFTVPRDNSIIQVQMKDQATKLLIEKREAGSGDSNQADSAQKRLGGAYIQLIDSSGRMIYQFITKAGSPSEITGILKKGEWYQAVEIDAPPGYALAEPVFFQVPEEEKILTILIEDERLKEPTHEEKRPVITLKKYDGITFEGLKGGEFTIYNPDGSIYKKVKTDEKGYAAIPKPGPGTYTIKETKPPKGYLLSCETYTFTIFRAGGINGDLMIPDWPSPEISILKVDEETKEHLPGAEFEIYDEEGGLCQKGSTGENGVWFWTPLQEGTYFLIETKAPGGYEKNSIPSVITISKTGEVTGQTVIENKKLEKKEGRLTAFYDKKRYGLGFIKLPRGEKWLEQLPKTGEEYNPFIEMAAALIMIFSICLFLIRKWNGNRTKKSIKKKDVIEHTRKEEETI